MNRFFLYIWFFAVVNSLYAGEQRIQFGRFGEVALYFNGERPTQGRVVIFVSGDGGWNLGVVNMARILTQSNTLVAGIDIRRYLKSLESSTESCSFAAADFEMLSKYLQKRFDFKTYEPPVLIGYSSGATLVYALVAQAPAGTFRGGISMGFCPDLPLKKPLCRGSGLSFEQMPKGKGYYFLPDTSLASPWIALQGDIDVVCPASNIQQFVKKCGANARLTLLPKVGHGFSVEKNWVPQFKESFSSFFKTNEEKKVDISVSDLPLVEVTAKGDRKKYFAILVSGDGGWVGIDKEIAEALADSGIQVVGLNSLQYFWTKKDPETTSRDLSRIITHYSTTWEKESVVLVGYSMGADVLPFMVNRLSQEARRKISMLALAGLSTSAKFEFHLTDWIGNSSGKETYPVLPELERLRGTLMLYFYGLQEKDSLSSIVDTTLVKKIGLPGGHHFNGNYQAIVSKIIATLRYTQ